MGTMIAIGETYPLFEKSMKMLNNQDGGVFEALENGDGFLYTMFLNQPSKEEINLVRTKDIKVRLIDEEPFVLPLIQFDNSRMIFEMSFDPTLYQDDRAFQMKQSNNVLTIVLVDSSTHVVHALRSANLPLRFIQRCGHVWAKAFLEPDFSNRYKQWFRKKQEIDLESLWEHALYLGKMGETYNIEEVHYAPNSDFYH